METRYLRVNHSEKKVSDLVFALFQEYRGVVPLEDFQSRLQARFKFDPTQIFDVGEIPKLEFFDGETELVFYYPLHTDGKKTYVVYDEDNIVQRKK